MKVNPDLKNNLKRANLMNTIEDIEDEILNLMKDIFIWFADLAPYFTDAKSFKDIIEADLPYFRNIDNIMRICHIDEVYLDQGEENHYNIFKLNGFESPFTYRAIQYQSGYYFIDMYKLASDYSWELRNEKELELEDLYSLIYALIRILNS
jgi:hypothetical protein